MVPVEAGIIWISSSLSLPCSSMIDLLVALFISTTNTFRQSPSVSLPACSAVRYLPFTIAAQIFDKLSPDSDVVMFVPSFHSQRLLPKLNWPPSHTCSDPASCAIASTLACSEADFGMAMPHWLFTSV